MVVWLKKVTINSQQRSLYYYKKTIFPNPKLREGLSEWSTPKLEDCYFLFAFRFLILVIVKSQLQNCSRFCYFFFTNIWLFFFKRLENFDNSITYIARVVLVGSNFNSRSDRYLLLQNISFRSWCISFRFSCPCFVK